jgi:acetyltransferase
LSGGLFPVNPKHASVQGVRAYPRLDRLPSLPDLAVIVTPARTVPGIIDQAGALGIKAAIVLSGGFAEAGAAGARLQEEMLAAARVHGVRLLGPNCLGAMRTDTGLNATFARKPARAGNLAVVSQSGAICGALLDWADRAAVGFTSVVSLGAALDVDFGEILDFLIADASTEAVLLYVEGVRDARRYLSALRAAARVKPVIALKVGRYARADVDAVFDAALRRAGTVRVRTYSQLFAAARAVASTRYPQGERLAILTNGGGPGVVAADSAAENAVPLAALVDIGGDATPERFAEATAALLADPGVDALLAMYSPVGATEPEAAARAVAQAAAGVKKPLLTAWLGDFEGIANFQTPESAVEAFSFLCAHRRNQAQLMEAPTVRAADEPRPDLASAAALRDTALGQERRLLTQDEARALLVAFGLPVPDSIAAPTRAAAVAAAEKIGFPVVLKIHSPDITHKSDVGGVRLALQNADMVASAFDDTMRHVHALRPAARIDGVVLQPMLRYPHSREVLIGAATDPVFGPVVVFGAGGVAVDAVRDTALALPPLNAALARELMSRTRVHRLLAGYRDVPPADFDALARILCGVSRILCALPWVKELDLNPVLAHPGGAVIADARVLLHGPESRKLPAQGRRYPHLAIHPYPTELEGELRLRDGSRLPMRPMRPEDVELELAFFRGLSERSRYQRFMQQLSDLPPRLLARFTQLDYDRELALVVLHEGRFVSVGRYAPNPDGTTAEFALTVADEWQGKGIGSALLERLCSSARDAGYAALYGNILADNHDMLHLAARLGFTESSRDGSEVVVVRRL